MKYSIYPHFKIEDQKYWILSDEIDDLTKEELADIVEDIENVFQNKYNETSFSGKVVSTVKILRDESTIWYYNEKIGTIATQELFQMLKSLLNKV